MNIEDVKLLIKINTSKRKNDHKIRFYEGPCFLFYTLWKHHKVWITRNIPKWIVTFYKCCISKCCSRISFCMNIAETYIFLFSNASLFNHFTLVLTSFYQIFIITVSFLNWCCKLIPQNHSLQFSIYQEFQLLIRFFLQNVVKHFQLIYYSRGPSFKTSGWLQEVDSVFHPFDPSIKWVPGTHGELAVKSKISPYSGSAALRQSNPIHKKGP